jgi:hypothetical protein
MSKMAMHQDEAQARSELLLRDAEEALQQERLREFWKAWGPTIIGMCVMLVVGTGAGVAWREWRDSRNADSTTQLIKVANDPAVPMTDDAARDMTRQHAAMAWLAKAGTLSGKDKLTDEERKNLAQYFEAAAKKGDDTAWGWLGRWNALRMRMDDETAQPKDLIEEFDELAGQMGDSPLAALPYSDAAILAGERLKDPKAAIEYLDKAEKVSADATQMQVHIADLRHLYEIRAAKQETAPKETNQ